MIENRFDYEFHTIVLAGGRGSRMNHILHGRPKCLLPIANRPMIQYSLELLQRHNILGLKINKSGFSLLIDRFISIQRLLLSF